MRVPMRRVLELIEPIAAQLGVANRVLDVLMRSSEQVELTWPQIKLGAGRIHITRAKNGTASTHPLTGGLVIRKEVNRKAG